MEDGRVVFQAYVKKYPVVIPEICEHESYQLTDIHPLHINASSVKDKIAEFER
jgi:hypothetical protein